MVHKILSGNKFDITDPLTSDSKINRGLLLKQTNQPIKFQDSVTNVFFLFQILNRNSLVWIDVLTDRAKSMSPLASSRHWRDIKINKEQTNETSMDQTSIFCEIITFCGTLNTHGFHDKSQIYFSMKIHTTEHKIISLTN